MIKIVTDSTCDLTPEYYQECDISVVPINIQFGTDSYLDRVTIDQTMFYKMIEESGTLPKTSQPSPGQFEERYGELADAGATDIISVHCTAKLSGTFSSAEMARKTMQDRVRVHPFDGAGGSAGLGFMAVEAARMVAEGQGVQEILDRMVEMRSRMKIILTLKDLKFAQMSGRVGRMQSSLASLLNVKPIVVLEDGLLDVSEKVRRRSKALDRMIEILVERVGTSAPTNLAVVHAEAPEEGHDLLERVRSLFNCQESFVTDLALSLAVQFGPGTLGLVGYRI
jgi:DegV family protein with EDD domain